MSVTQPQTLRQTPLPITSHPHQTAPASGPAALLLRRAAIFVFALLIACAAPAAHAQRRPRRETNANRQARIARTIEETYSHRLEFAGGGGFLRFRSGEDLQKNSEIAFFFDGTYYLNQKLGLTAEIRGAYGNAKIGNTIYNIPNPQISEYPFLFGPTYRVYMKERYAASVFTLVGAALGKFDGDTKGIPPANLGLWPTATQAAVSIGGNFDLNLYPNIAFRIAPAYTATTFGSKLQNNVGFNMGIVYRIGHRK